MRMLSQGTAEADGAVVDLTGADSPSPTQRDEGPSKAAAAVSAADEHVQGARVPPAPGVPNMHVVVLQAGGPSAMVMVLVGACPVEMMTVTSLR